MQKLFAVKLFTMAMLALVCAGGCSMCAHPYDDCYPVVHDGGYPSGSPDGDYAANRQQAPQQQQQQPYYGQSNNPSMARSNSNRFPVAF